MEAIARERLVVLGVVLLGALGLLAFGTPAVDQALGAHFLWLAVLVITLALGILTVLPRMGVRKATREWTLLALALIAMFLLLASFGWSSDQHALRKNYLLGVAVTTSVYALMALGLSVEMGYAGLLNFGHVAFMSIGAYAGGVFATKFATKCPTFTPVPGCHEIYPALIGAQPWAFVVLGLVGLLVAAISYVLLLLALPKLRIPRGAALGAALALALALGAFVAWSAFPMGQTEAKNAVFFLGMLAGIVLAALAALLVGFAGLRLREDYLAIATLGFAEVIRLVTVNEQDLTNGTQGIQSMPAPVAGWATSTPWFRDLAARWQVLPAYLANALLAMLAVAIVFVLLQTLARSPWGRVLKAIREDEDVASALGKNVLLYKLQALMIGSAIAAVAGIVFTLYVASAFPENFLAIVTFYTFAILVLGGVGNHKGAIIGAIIIWTIFEIANNLTALPYFEAHHIQFAGPPQLVLVGLVLILVVMVRPQGIVGSKEEMSLGK